MKIFDEITRNSFESAKYTEPKFTYLNQSAREEFARIRCLFEEWFSRYPSNGQKELRSRLRSNIDQQHQAAFFELFLYELLLRLGCQIKIHPTIVGKKNAPDFLIESKNGYRFYIEATVATGEPVENVAAHTRMNVVYDVLNRLVESPNFFLWLVIDGAPATPPPAKKLAKFVSSKLSILDPDKVGIRGLQSWSFEHDGWKIEIRPTPKKPEARGKTGVRPIGMMSTGFQWADDRISIRDSIMKKANKYSKLDLPFVIAVNAIQPVDETDIMEALFGKEQYAIPISLEMPRIPDGVWSESHGPRNTRVSAVLMATHLSTFNVPRAILRLYHNPWAQKPYHSDLCRLPQAIPEKGYISKLDGESISTIFGLPLSWPESTV